MSTNINCSDPSSTSAPICAFDHNVNTYYAAANLSYAIKPLDDVTANALRAQYENGTLPNPTLTEIERIISLGECVIGLNFDTPVLPTYARVFPRLDPQSAGNSSSAGKRYAYAGNMVGARLQGTADPQGQTGWFDLAVIQSAPAVGEWTQYALVKPRGQSNQRYARLRYLGAPCAGVEPPKEYTQDGTLIASAVASVPPGTHNGVECRCDIGELEWHTAWEGDSLGGGEGLTNIDDGLRSHVVDIQAVNANPEAAMIVKCAGRNLYPEYTDKTMAEIMTPEANGVLLTTGNLRDITKEKGSMSSASVAGDVLVGGSTVLGQAGKATTLQIKAVVDGRFPLTFAGPDEGAGSLTLGVPDPTRDSFLHIPDASGKLVTTGSLPGVMETIAVVGESVVQGAISMHGDVSIGDRLRVSSLEFNTPIGGAFPLKMAGQSRANGKITVGVQDPTQDRLLVLPDVSGTVITTGNLPEVFEESTFIGQVTFKGGALLGGKDVIIGPREGSFKEVALEVHGSIRGGTPLVFEGKSIDGRTLSLSVEEPAGNNILTLPDVSGTVITTGNFPDMLETMRVVGKATLEGETLIGGEAATLGAIDGTSSLEVCMYVCIIYVYYVCVHYV